MKTKSFYLFLLSLICLCACQNEIDDNVDVGFNSSCSNFEVLEKINVDDNFYSTYRSTDVNYLEIFTLGSNASNDEGEIDLWLKCPYCKKDLLNCNCITIPDRNPPGDTSIPVEPTPLDKEKDIFVKENVDINISSNELTPIGEAGILEHADLSEYVIKIHKLNQSFFRPESGSILGRLLAEDGTVGCQFESYGENTLIFYVPRSNFKQDTVTLTGTFKYYETIAGATFRAKWFIITLTVRLTSDYSENSESAGSASIEPVI